MKNQCNRTSVGQEDATALTSIVHWICISTFSNCYGLLFFLLFSSQLHFNLALPAIFITQLAHSCYPFSFVVEALTAKVMYRTGRFVACPTATFTVTETPHCGRRPECDCRWPGPAQPAGVGGAKPQRAAANGNRAGGSRSPGIGWC